MKRKTRPPIAQDHVYNHVQSLILDRSLDPGERLPSRLTFEESFGVSSVTVQRAFDRLVQDGFVEVRGAEGTFVSGTPPHLFRYALAYPDPLDSPFKSQWYSTLSEMAATIEHLAGCKITQYSAVDDGVKSAGVDDLLEDVRGRRLAGIVFVRNPHLSYDTLKSVCLSLPCVAVVSTRSPIVAPGFMQVELGGPTGFSRRALEYLRQKGRRRIAKLAVSGMKPERLDYFHRYANELGLETAPAWLHGIDPREAKWASNIVQLLFSRNNSDRPDALIISDDNLEAHACRGLVEAGVRVPEEVEVVSYCNFPSEAPRVVPLVRLGYDSQTALTTSIELIDRRNRGDKTPDLAVLDAVFEWELEAARTTAR